jgi:mannose-1-phosphate guanylyltransferase
VVAADARLTGPVVIGAETTVGSGCEIYGPTVIGGGCVIEPGAVIRESVLLPGVRVGAGMVIGRALIGDAARTTSAIRRHHLP